MDPTRLVVCVRIREIHCELLDPQARDWAPCPACYRKLHVMAVQRIVTAELVVEGEWD